MKTKTFVKAWWIIVENNNLLICKRKQHKDYVLPKWHCDNNESLEECAIREVQEETWYVCEIQSYIGTHSYEKIINDEKIISIVYVFQMKKISYDSQKILDHEIEDVLRIPLSKDGIDKLTHRNDRDFVSDHVLWKHLQ